MLTLSLCFALTAGQSQPAFALKAKAAQAARTLVFSKDYTVGALFNDVMADQGRLTAPSDVAKTIHTLIGDARGTVKIPAGTRLYLLAAAPLAEHPEILRTLDPDTFICISFDKIGVLQPLDKAIDCVTHLTGLQRLDLEYAEESDESIKKLARLPNLTVLDLNMCGLTGTFLQAFGANSSIKNLALSDCKLNPVAYKYLSVMHNLEALNLVRTGSDNSSLPYLIQLSNLNELFLDDTRITPEKLPQLLKLKKLKVLGLTGSKFQARDLLCFASANLKDLYLPYEYSVKDLAMLHKAMPHTDLHLRFKKNVDNFTKSLFAPTK